MADPSTDVCDITRLMECVKNGHDPLTVRGDKESSLEITHNESGVVFAKIMFCQRCGTVYWEPKKP